MTRKLTSEQKRFLVQQAAEMTTPGETADEFHKVYGFKIKPQLTECYNPTKQMGRDLSQPLRELFATHRETFLNDTAAVPISNKRFRLEVLNELLTKAKEQDDWKAMFRALELAAKETGGYVIRQEIETSDRTLTTREITADERREAAAFFEFVETTGNYSLTLEQYRLNVAEKGRQ